MRRTTLLLSKFISIPIILGIYICVALTIVNSAFGWDILYGLPRNDSPGELNLRILAGWLFILFFPHVINGILLSRISLLSVFIRIRIRDTMWYYLLRYKLCIENTVIWSVILIGVHSLRSTAKLLAILIVFISHMVMWTLIMMVFDVVLHESSISIIIAPAACISFISMAEQFPTIASIVPSSYGMISRSSLFYEKGYSPYVMVLLNTSISALCIFVIYLLLRLERCGYEYDRS